MGYWALKGCEGLVGSLDVERGGTYAETGDEDIDFLLKVIRSFGGSCVGRARRAGSVISHGCGYGSGCVGDECVVYYFHFLS